MKGGFGLFSSFHITLILRNILDCIFLQIMDCFGQTVRKRVLMRSHKTLVQISLKSQRLMEAVREAVT